jgi:hypothetical protein
MVLSSLSGEAIEPEPQPQQVTTVLDRVARLQAVKCSPFADGSQKRRPEGTDVHELPAQIPAR